MNAKILQNKPHVNNKNQKIISTDKVLETILDSNLDAYVVRVFTYIKSRCYHGYAVPLSLRYLAKKMICSPNRAKKSLNQLIELGYIIKTKKHTNRNASEYMLADCKILKFKPKKDLECTKSTRISKEKNILSKLCNKQVNNNHYSKNKKTTSLIKIEKNRGISLVTEEKNKIISKKEYPKKDHIQVISKWNEECSNGHMLGPLEFLNAERSVNIENVEKLLKIKNKTISWFIKKIFESNFLNGKNKKNWKASFDWAFDVHNAVKIISGNYDNDQDNFNNLIDNIFEKIPRFGRFGTKEAKNYFDKKSWIAIEKYGGWERLCLITDFEIPSIKKKFKEIFKTIQKDY